MRIVRFLLIVVLACMCVPQPAAALWLNDDDIPGKPIVTRCTGSVDANFDQNDVFRVYLSNGEGFQVNLDGPAAPVDFDLHLYGPGADAITDSPVATANSGSSDEALTYFATEDGWHYLRVRAFAYAGSYNLLAWRFWNAPVSPRAVPDRIWGSDRYATAVAIARENFPNWYNLDHVIIACGEDRAAADPLAASGLVWAYGAPILLVRSASVPDGVMQSLTEIRAANGPFTVHVVGGPVSVSQPVIDAITSQVPDVTIDRIAPYGSRYELAESIAYRASQERPGESWGTPPFHTALIANGEDPTKFFDALALSPVAASTGYPILLVRGDSVPGPTADALSNLALTDRIVAGGTATISDSVFAQLDSGPAVAWRWAGHDRYETAETIMTETISRFGPEPVYASNVGIAAKLPDALTGGAFQGIRGGCILVTRTTNVPVPTYEFLHSYGDVIANCAVFGGINSINDQAVMGIANAMQP